MPTQANVHSVRTPYLGAETYGLEHRDLFFGREAEGRIVAGMIAVEPVSVLTGASGTGKSSLLRAHVIPTLINRGWCTIYAYPQGDPVQAICDEMMAQALPDDRYESDIIAAILAAMKVGTVGSHSGSLDRNSRLSEVQSWFQRLDPTDTHRSSLLASSEGPVPRTGLLAKVLADLITPAQAAEQLSDLGAYAGAKALPPDPTLDEVQQILEATRAGRVRLLRLLNDGASTLTELALSLWSGWVVPLGLNGIIIVLDQAEELFTAFGPVRVGHGLRGELPASAGFNWKIREKLFQEIPEFLTAAQRYPMRLCFSLRPEWYTDLTRIMHGGWRV